MKIGEQIKKIRKEKQLSQKEVSKRANISQNFLSEIENGKSCGISTIESICSALGITLSFLFKEEYEDMNYSITTDISSELQEIGIEYIALAKEFKDKNIPPEVVKKILDAFSSYDK
ncbi:helix-turn-helix transcriptional regulator [Ruminiclostridium herbifermentans]|uniref:Helix-turn-helix transcriptional regulator n=1 Tax=Ruminiclostridium herbifermentans TaxID=2488810 RepID=A0A4U7JH42_9FIRM|nr:helix-turn-helix transcriptional regulator [Ruminiclostridium herbifermentans]QNU67236.1 helix-turn-helix transcriptional regulator [Ruminiclostridium herbifermentans]